MLKEEHRKPVTVMTHKTEITGTGLYRLCDLYLSRLANNGDPCWFFLSCARAPII